MLILQTAKSQPIELLIQQIEAHVERQVSCFVCFFKLMFFFYFAGTTISFSNWHVYERAPKYLAKGGFLEM